MTEEEKNETGKVTRREFLKDAGFVVGGAAIGSTVLLAACAPEAETETVTTTTTVTETVSKFVCPYDGLEFNTLSALEAHFEAEHPGAAIEGLTILTVNGQVYVTQVKPYWTLAFVLRETLGLPGTKNGCDRGTCGTCTVIVDGKSVYSCMMLAMDADGKDILTIEGLSDGLILHPIQQAFIDNNSMQCGYCIPGYIMSTKALLNENPNPTFDEVREGLAGHYCSCGNTKRIVESAYAAGGG